MNLSPELLPVVQITLPITLTIALAVIVGVWFQNSRFADLRGDMNRQFDDVNRQFDEIKGELKEIRTALMGKDGYGERIAKLEERTPPLVRQ